jgi:hypothetical protein
MISNIPDFESALERFFLKNFDNYSLLEVSYISGEPVRVEFYHEDDNHNDPPSELNFRYKNTDYDLRLEDYEVKDNTGLAFCRYSF